MIIVMMCLAVMRVIVWHKTMRIICDQTHKHDTDYQNNRLYVSDLAPSFSMDSRYDIASCYIDKETRSQR